MTLDRGRKSQPRVTSVHSWYLTSFVILSFCCLPFASSWRSQTLKLISLARIPSVFFFHSRSKGEFLDFFHRGYTLLYAFLLTHSNLNTPKLVSFLHLCLCCVTPPCTSVGWLNITVIPIWMILSYVLTRFRSFLFFLSSPSWRNPSFTCSLDRTSFVIIV